MILLPDFTENSDDAVIMYFAVNGDKKSLEKTIDETYYCYESLKYETLDSKEYLALTVKGLDEE